MEMRVADRYELREILGEGGFGRVYLAYDVQERRLVAVKLLQRIDPDTLTRFEREARMLLRNIDNQYVVELLAHDFAAPHPYLVLEYCNGGSLRSWVTARRPLAEALTALAQVVQGLHGIHAAGGFHRDIKPENLLVSTSPSGFVVKVGDFGLARVPESIAGEMTRSPAGTDGYIAPEVLTGGAFSSSADVYSLGVVALELVTGGRSAEALGVAPIPAGLVALIRSMLSRDPLERPSMPEVATHLARIIAEPPRAPKPRAGANWNGVLLTGLVVGGLALLASGGGTDWDKSVRRYRGADGRFRRR